MRTGRYGRPGAGQRARSAPCACPTVRSCRPSMWSSVRGSPPRSRWLAGSGLDVSRGVPVDPHGRTAVDRVFAAGDAAATFDKSSGTHVPGRTGRPPGARARAPARLMLGLEPGPAPLTSFWTDQYGLRIQYIGQAEAPIGSRSTVTRPAATSPPPSPVPVGQSPRCSWTGLAVYPRHAKQSRKENDELSSGNR